jgi:hypothetical protein
MLVTLIATPYTINSGIYARRARQPVRYMMPIGYTPSVIMEVACAYGSIYHFKCSLSVCMPTGTVSEHNSIKSFKDRVFER